MQDTHNSGGAPVWKVVLLVVLFIVAGSVTLFRGNYDSVRIREQVLMQFKTDSVYEGNREYVDRLVYKHHDAAFSRYYIPGGRRRPASFDKRAYCEMIGKAMMEQAQTDGKDDVARSARNLYLGALKAKAR